MLYCIFGLQICDSDLNILSVDASFGGASHDSFIWNQHPVKDHLIELINSGESAILLGITFDINFLLSIYRLGIVAANTYA